MEILGYQIDYRDDNAMVMETAKKVSLPNNLILSDIESLTSLFNSLRQKIDTINPIGYLYKQDIEYILEKMYLCLYLMKRYTDNYKLQTSEENWEKIVNALRNTLQQVNTYRWMWYYQQQYLTFKEEHHEQQTDHINNTK